MPNPLLDRIEQTLQDTFNHISSAGAFNEGRPGQVSGEDLPENVKALVDRLARQRGTLHSLTALGQGGEKARVQLQDVQNAINNLYNPRTRQAAMSSWQQMGSDVSDAFSPVGGDLAAAARYANNMTSDPIHFQYGGQRK